LNDAAVASPSNVHVVILIILLKRLKREKKIHFVTFSFIFFMLVVMTIGVMLLKLKGEKVHTLCIPIQFPLPLWIYPYRL
jgi:heme A synthase